VLSGRLAAQSLCGTAAAQRQARCGPPVAVFVFSDMDATNKGAAIDVTYHLNIAFDIHGNVLAHNLKTPLRLSRWAF
jgi:hypothetical protein